jgi:hypothetical protein
MCTQGWTKPARAVFNTCLLCYTGAMITELFDGFLQERNVRLTKTQQKIAAMLFDAAESDDLIMDFLTRPAKGTTFFFELLDAFCSSRKILPPPDQMTTDIDWVAAYDALKKRVNQMGI